MSDAPAPGPAPAASGQANRGPRVLELKVSGQFMTLDTGVFCVVVRRSAAADPATGLPGVRLSVPPAPIGRADLVTIRAGGEDGWLSGFGDAALVHVAQGPAQLLVTVYQAPGAQDAAPDLQVLQLFDAVPPVLGMAAAAPAAAPLAAPAPAAVAAPATPAVMDMVAHIQGRGDVGAVLGEWLGEIGSKRWLEGFAIAPAEGIAMADIEYQAVLGRGWLSPWAEGGQFCGSRGMALPVLGLKLRLRGKAAEEMECFYSASFIDGTQVGPLAAGETCESESLAPLEAFQIVIRPKGGAAKPAPAATPARKPKAAAPAPAPAPAKKPAGRKAK